MGGRLSTPRGPDGLMESSRPTPVRRTINARTLTMPLAAITMAGLLFFYSRTSIRAAKLNAQKHREADGGQISWRNESARRHGMMENVNSKGLLQEALMAERKKAEAQKDGQLPITGEVEGGGLDAGKLLEDAKKRGR
ncbi:hypothetical protein LTS18_005953 [Coniosporium uncinatum]|uniref:Uncharacterized protein n=1 Tax=Coniosporium uncinatum TaxID=93489 RepID=A0ACC3D446_9PEZI|nr:hypothetical protein LTS18_005953 [Coniosporium uncinatum]